MRKRKITFYNSPAETACGLECVGGFKYQDTLAEWQDDGRKVLGRDEMHYEYEKGTGFAMSGFINTPVCKEAYQFLVSNYKLVYQSPVRVNENTDNKFFFIIYDTRSPAAKGN